MVDLGLAPALSVFLSTENRFLTIAWRDGKRDAGDVVLIAKTASLKSRNVGSLDLEAWAFVRKAGDFSLYVPKRASGPGFGGAYPFCLYTP